MVFLNVKTQQHFLETQSPVKELHFLFNHHYIYLLPRFYEEESSYKKKKICDDWSLTTGTVPNAKKY